MYFLIKWKVVEDDHHHQYILGQVLDLFLIAPVILAAGYPSRFYTLQ
jgi:hypothetical protein